MKRNTTAHILIHCAATKASMDVGAAEIRRWHKERGWSDIGYHFVIRRSGKIEPGRPVDDVGAHEPTRNKDSVAICLVGGIDDNGKPKNNFEPMQFVALESQIKTVMAAYPNQKIKVSGHNHWQPGRGCPSFDWQKWCVSKGFLTV